MQLFYSTEVYNNTIILGAEESLHCIRVLRMRTGEKINITDGKGSLYTGIITSANPNKVEINISDITEDYGRRGYRVHLAVSPLKNNERFEWLIEKAVEVGVDEITPLMCTRTEKTHIRKERYEKIILSAMKQSLRTYLPLLNNPAPFAAFLDADHSGIKAIAHCDSKTERLPLIKALQKGKDITIIIGPEGDFTDDEVAEALNRGFVSVHLGENRLRTETAGFAACCSVYLINM